MSVSSATDPHTSPRLLSVALTGVPNVGKSTLFNLLTGLNQHVGNWPGKTIEQKRGSLKHGKERIELIDLPGAYSLSCISPEEDVARDYLVFGNPDVIVVVINSAQIERGLSFLAEVLSLQKPTVVALNMIDVSKREGIAVDAVKLGKVLGIPVVELIARKNQGTTELLDAVDQVMKQGHQTSLEEIPVAPSVLQAAKISLLPYIEKLPQLNQLDSKKSGAVTPTMRFIAKKILEGDRYLIGDIEAALNEAERTTFRDILHSHETLILAIAHERYDWVKEICLCIGYEQKNNAFRFTNTVDRFATHPVWGMGLFLFIMYLLFSAVFTLGTPLQELLDVHLITPSSQYLLTNFPDSFWAKFVSGGIINGVGLVLSFVPIMLLFFLCMSFLEDVGYMTRAAFVMDRFMHAIGLHGRSFVPMFMGFGCNVPSIMAARVIDDRASRLLTMMLIPFVPCSARLAVIAFFGAAFFSEHAALFSWSMIALPLVILALVGLILSRTIFKGKRMPLIMELPLFHLPHAKGIILQTWMNTWAFIKRAGGLIAVFSIVIWLLSYNAAGNIALSPLGRIGQIFNPLAALFGSDWRMIVALITSFIVKENTISTLGVLTQVTTEEATLTAMRNILTPQAALAFMVIQMLFIPCVSTVVILKKESGSWKWPILGVTLQGVLSLVCGVLLFQALRFLG